MRKLILTEFKAQTGDHEFESWRMVVVNHNTGDTESSLLERATDAFRKQFPEYFPESILIYARAHPTWGEDVEVVKPSDSALHFTNFHNDSEKPEELPGQGFSDDVLIDIDGWRKIFRVGYYDHENDMWILYDKAEDVDRKHMTWTHLPISKEMPNPSPIPPKD